MHTIKIMLSLSLAVGLAGPGRAHADPPAADVTVRWDSGEMSRDMSVWRTQITVTGKKVHAESTYSGRDGGMPSTRPKAGDGALKDPKRLAAALAAFDKTKDPPAVKFRDTTAHRDSLCVARGKAERCAAHIDGDPETAAFKAAVEVKDAMIDGVTLAELPATP
jgi:hypothetical protein